MSPWLPMMLVPPAMVCICTAGAPVEWISLPAAYPCGASTLLLTSFPSLPLDGQVAAGGMTAWCADTDALVHMHRACGSL